MMYFRRIFQILIAVLVLILAGGTLIPSLVQNPEGSWAAFLGSNLFQSYPFIIIWLLIILALFAAATFSREMTGGSRVLHLTLAVTFALIGYDKFSNPPTLITLKEQSPVSVTLNRTHPITITLRLLRFDKQKTSIDVTAPQYQSTILLNERDTLLLTSNQSVKVGNYRMRLNAFQTKPHFTLIAGKDTLLVTSGDSLLFHNASLTVLYPDSVGQLPPLLYKNIAYQPSTNGLILLEKTPVWIKNASQVHLNTIAIIQLTKPKIILLLGSFYLLCLIYVLWWKSPQ